MLNNLINGGYYDLSIEDFNPNHDPENGQFTFSNGGGSKGMTPTANVDSQKKQNKKAFAILEKCGQTDDFFDKVDEHNPYIKKGVAYYINGEETVLYEGNTYTKQELRNDYFGTALRDMLNGYNERSVGYYDKWYRYSRADEGWAYDYGQRLASNFNPKASPDVKYIEINPLYI